MTELAAPNRRVLRLGTRGSALALAQSTLVAQALAARGIEHEVVIVETAGDRRAPDTAWGEGAFVTAIEGALVAGRVDVAVHSAKDVPTDEDPRLAIAALLAREEPRDALVLPSGRTGTLATLAAGTVVGTDSPRRTGFVRAHRADLEVRPLHGNVDTRLRRLDEGAVGALVLAAAGLIRLGRADRISELLPVNVVPPAPGQGAIAVQVRADDAEAREIVAAIDDAPTRAAVEAERAFLNATGGGCRAPIGALAHVREAMMELTAGFATLDGRAAALESVSGATDDRLSLARSLALRIVERRSRLAGAPRVLVTRPEDDALTLATRLAEHGIAAVVVPAIEIELLDDTPRLNEALTSIASFDWAIATSANGARAVARAATRLGIALSSVKWAAVGQSTARELVRHGAQDVWLPTQANAGSLARELPNAHGSRVLWLHGELADASLSDVLGQRGAALTKVAVYRTTVGPTSSITRLENVMSEAPIDAIILASPSAARGLLSIARGRQSEILATPAVCIGEQTAGAARAAGFNVAAVARSPDAGVVAEVAAQIVRPSLHNPQEQPLDHH